MLKIVLVLLFTLISSLTCWIPAAQANVPVTGQFVASKTCPAVQSIRTQANPGRIRLKRQAVYPVIAKNNEVASHYLIRVEGANPVERWVSVSCGRFDGSAPPDVPPPAQTAQNYLLAISWQPSFCETKPDKDECQSQTADRFDAKNLALHGLWPQGSDYCQVSREIQALDKQKRWSELPPIALSEAIRKDLAVKMPGYTSDLHLHEWYKHGTCYSATPDEYFQESIALLDQINASPVQQLFADNIGRDISSQQIRTAFTQAFGADAGNKVQVQCKRDIDQAQNDMIVELQVNLRGNIQANTAIADLLKQGKNVGAGCPSGEVDPAGLEP